jgi:multiple sugar transport system substrate-binding protein
MGNGALATLKTLMNRRTLLRGSAAGVAGLGLATLGRPSGVDRVQAAQNAVCGGEEIKITYGFWDDAQRPAVEQQIAAFKELHPNITVEPQVVPWDDYWTKL